MKKAAFLCIVFLHFSSIYGQLFKIMLLPGDFWTVHVEKSFITQSRIECASHCTAESGDYFVYENETLDCFTGMTDQQFDLVPIRTEGGKVYVNMGKIIDLMALITVRLHTVTQTENWKKHIYSSESLIQAGLPMPYYVDCAYFCLKVDIDKCQFFIFLENTCHLGSYDTIDGDLDIPDTTLQVYLKTETLNTVKFDGNFTLPGSLWNEYILWNIALETANAAEECTGFCYFQHPDPIECSFAVADTTNAMCYLGSMESTSGQGGYSETNALTTDTDFVGTIESSSVDAWIEIHYNTYQTTRWTPMVYEVSSEKSLQFCALYCYSRPDKQCQFFFHTGTDCNLGSFSSSDSASSTSGHHTIHINYNAVSDTDEFLDTTYDYSLSDVKSNLMSRLMSVNTDAVSTEYECAAFCQVAYPDCYFYLFESICHAGSLDQTSGSFAGTAGSKTLTFDNERTTTFLTNHYTIKKSFTGRVWGATSYEEKSIVEIKDCQMYCFLDNVQPCHAYWAENTECHLYFFTPVSKADQPEDSKELNWNSATLDTLLNAQFTSEYSSGSYWTQYIYETVSGIDDLTQCKLVCYTDTQCDYCAFHGGICYLGDFSTTESVTGPKGTDYVYHRSQPTDGLLDDALDLYETNTKFRSSIWPKFVYTYISSGGNEWLCAAKCALRYTNCHFYWHSGSYCYIGDFTRHPYTYLGDTNAPIKVLKGRYDFKAAANKASGSSACRNWGYREVTDPNSWGFQIAIAPYGSNMACHWVIYNPYPSTTLRINFGYFHTEGCCDYFKFYVGPDTSYPYIGVWGGLFSSGLSMTWTEPLLYITWRSDGGVQNSANVWGWIGVV